MVRFAGKMYIDPIFVFDQLFLYVILSMVMECSSSADWIWNSGSCGM